MLKVFPAALIFLYLLTAAVSQPAAAQGVSRDISQTLSRLKNNPRYRGRVLGTHIRRDRGKFLYEVRILRRDDQVILVYIDPETGGVVGDSERSGVRPSRSRNENPKPNRTGKKGRDNSKNRRR